ncbi:MAG: A24 family peptidase [Gammaproteobacteria bacterium]|nr:A24 family peptidase [Gammaproteobacteria bacterium]
MSIVDFFLHNAGIFYSFIFLIGLSIGSFLNVVIYRLPLMLDKDWKAQCRELLELKQQTEQVITLSKPASTCPKCQHKIRIWENIPLISYLFLKGKCSQCHTPISIQYPLVELLTAVLSLTVAIKFGVSWQTLFGLILTWSLVAMSVIDLQKLILPDDITLPVLWLGLLLSLFSIFVDPANSITGAIAGYMILWSVYQLFKLVTGKEGMGYGDFKLLALFGAWLGWEVLPLIIILSSASGAIIGIVMIVFKKHKRDIPIPFGPYLAIAGWITLIWGQQIMLWYLG